MIENYFFAMVFTVVRLVIPIPPIVALAMTGFKIVVWSMMCSKPFLSIILLDWRTAGPLAMPTLRPDWRGTNHLPPFGWSVSACAAMG